MDKQKSVPRGVYILPNLLTTASLLSGFMGVIWTTQGLFEHACVAILASAVFDGLDGKVARLTNTTSEFGVQYDSLCDLVAFGVSPALLVYFWQAKGFGRLGLMACFLFLVCGALRLARFNVQSARTSGKHFVGLPIPAAACTVACLVLASPFVPEVLVDKVLPVACLVLTYALSFLMVSKVRYASFKEYGVVKAHPFSSMVTAILVFVLVASQPRPLGLVLMLGYVLSGPIYTYIVLPRRRPGLLRDSF